MRVQFGAHRAILIDEVLSVTIVLEYPLLFSFVDLYKERKENGTTILDSCFACRSKMYRRPDVYNVVFGSRSVPL